MYLSSAIGSGDRYLKQPDRGTSEIDALCRAHTLHTGLQDLIQSTRGGAVFWCASRAVATAARLSSLSNKMLAELSRSSMVS